MIPDWRKHLWLCSVGEQREPEWDRGATWKRTIIYKNLYFYGAWCIL